MSKAKTNVHTSAEIRESIANHSPTERHLRCLAVAAEAAAAEAAKFIDDELVYHGQEIDDPDLVKNRWRDIAPAINEAQQAEFFSVAINSRPAVIEARGKLDPLYHELATAIERERIEAAEAAQAAQDLRDAQAAARAELESKIDDHPAVVEAHRKLEPFRRLGALVGA